MTKAQARKEMKKILSDHVAKAEQITKKAKQDGTWAMGLDANKGLFAELHAETDRKLQQLATMVDED